MSDLPSLSTPSSLNLASLEAATPDIARVYELFSLLSQAARAGFDGVLGGKLLLVGPLDAEGLAATVAASIAGAASLGIDSNQEQLKQAFRNGFCDFWVTTLDEALRILKNEIRKKQPVSVCVEGDEAATLGEIVERGVQPDLLTRWASGPESLILIERGAKLLEEQSNPRSQGLVMRWKTSSAPALWLPKVDALAAEVLPPGDERRRWLQFAPRYLGRSMAGSRYLPVGLEEADRFQEILAQQVERGAIGAEIILERE